MPYADFKAVLGELLFAETNAHFEEMNVETLPEGMYLLQAITDMDSLF